MEASPLSQPHCTAALVSSSCARHRPHSRRDTQKCCRRCWKLDVVKCRTLVALEGCRSAKRRTLVSLGSLSSRNADLSLLEAQGCHPCDCHPFQSLNVRILVIVVTLGCMLLEWPSMLTCLKRFWSSSVVFCEGFPEWSAGGLGEVLQQFWSGLELRGLGGL